MAVKTLKILVFAFFWGVVVWPTAKTAFPLVTSTHWVTVWPHVVTLNLIQARRRTFTVRISSKVSYILLGYFLGDCSVHCFLKSEIGLGLIISAQSTPREARRWNDRVEYHLIARWWIHIFPWDVLTLSHSTMLCPGFWFAENRYLSATYKRMGS